MHVDFEKAQIMFKLMRKNNWGNCYDRLELFKRFEKLNETVTGLSKTGRLIIHKKGDFTGISLNTQFKKEIIEFIEEKMPYLKSLIR